MSTETSLCRSVRFSTEGELQHVMQCHTGMCREAQGSPVVTFRIASAAAFAWLEGKELRSELEASPEEYPYFCSRRASVLPGAAHRGEVVFVPLGTLDDETAARRKDHMFLRLNAPWHKITSDVPQFDAYPSGVDATPVQQSATEPDTRGAVAGHCLCFVVRFEVAGEPVILACYHFLGYHHARAAAQASILFLQQFHWLTAKADRVSAPTELPYGNLRVCTTSLARRRRLLTRCRSTRRFQRRQACLSRRLAFGNSSAARRVDAVP